MLEATGQVDAGVLLGLRHQFQALDSSGDGAVGMDDFPKGMGLKKVHKTFNGNTTSDVSVVPLPTADGGGQPLLTRTPSGRELEVLPPDALPAHVSQALEAKPEEAEKPSSNLKDGLGGVLAITAYIGIGCSYYSPHLGWTLNEVVYFTFTTVTTGIAYVY